MHGKTFEIEATDTTTWWAELEDRRIIIHRTDHSPLGAHPELDEVLLQWDVDVVRNLLAWAGHEASVITTFEGPLAHQIREHARELGMSSEMFVWHAVKVFIEVGSGPQ